MPFATHSKATLSNLYAQQRIAVSDIELLSCSLERCVISAGESLDSRSEISNVIVRNCTFRDCSAVGAVFRDVDVQGLKRRGRQPLILWGSVFCNVRLAGSIGFFKLALAPNAARASAAYAQRWARSCADFYAGVDWALDITAAKFTFGPDLHFVPGHLVRRDPSTQILVTKDQARSALASDLPLGESSVAIALKWFHDDSPYDSTVIAAPLGSKLCEQELAAFETLRSRGLAA